MRILYILIFVFSTFQVFGQIWDFDGVRRLGGEVNSEAEETLPVFSKDSSLLYFIRSNDKKNKGGEFDQDIWKSIRKEDGGYGDCKQETSLNTKYNNGVVGISTDGSTLYLLNTYQGKKDLEKGIAFSKKKGAGWGTPEKIEVPNLDIDGDFYGFHISEDEKTMLVSYQGPGTFGLEDLYVSLKSGSGWSAPINLGSDINTTGFEMSPFLSKNQDTLFFTSNGHGGFGDADIFYSIKKDSWTSWSKPVNLGSKINSPKFDACFSYNGSQVYWASNRESALNDIYTAYYIFPPPLSITCKAKNASFYQGYDGKIELTIEGGAEPFTFNWSNGMQTKDISGLKKGEFSVTVIDNFKQEATATCFVDEPAPVVFEPVDVDSYKNLEFMYYFDYNKNKLSVTAGDLKKFVKQIEKQLSDGRERITINVYSSASKVPTTTYESNEQLTQMRAENMKYDLITYFEGKKEFVGRVNVTVVSAIVDGPDYVDDSVDKKKYRPYQFVGLKTE